MSIHNVNHIENLSYSDCFTMTVCDGLKDSHLLHGWISEPPAQQVHFSYFFQLSASSLSPPPTFLPPSLPSFFPPSLLSFSLRKTELLTRSPELPLSSDHRLEFLWSGLVISLMLLLAVSYRFHYCRSMQSPCEVGGGMEEEEKKGGMRASYSQIYQPASACRKSP